MSRFDRGDVTNEIETDEVETTEVEVETEGGDYGDETPPGEATPPKPDRVAQLENNQAVLALLADPDIRKIVDARRTGRQVTVSEAVAESKPDPVEDLVKDLPEEDPTRGLLGKLSELIDRKMGGTLETLDRRLKEIESLGNEVRGKEVNAEIAAVRTKYKDFDRYRDKMVEITKTNPGLRVEDLYVLAKSRAGELRLAERATETEKPSAQPPKSVHQKPRTEGAQPRGRKAFNDLLANALNELKLD